MQRNKNVWYFLLCILISILPVSCDVQKRRYMPGYFVQKRSSLPGRSYLPGKYISRNLRENNIDDYARNKTIIEKAENAPQVCIENKQLHDNGMLSESLHNKAIVSHEKANNNTDKVKLEVGNTPVTGKGKASRIPGPIRNNEYENLMLAFLAGAGSVLLFPAIRSGLKKYKGYHFNGLNNSSSEATEPNKAEKTKEKIANMADRIDRCADRFANAKIERVALAARKVAIAINKCDDLNRAEELEKTFNDIYLSSFQASALQHLKLNNLLSHDPGYSTLKPDVVTTTGGYYTNSAGSLSWTMGEPISETVSDTSNTLTQGFQQGSYSVVTVVDELVQPTINISVYPNPVSSLLNIRSDSSDPFHAKVIDLQGNLVYEQPVESGQGQIDLGNLSDEIYILEVYDKDGNRIKVFKIQKVD